MATVLITGASAGLGTDFARILARQKYDLILVARNEERLTTLATQLAAEHGVKTYIISLDLSVSGSAEALVQDLRSKGLSVDVLINNAGYGMHGPVVDADVKTLVGMLQLNITTLTELTRLLLPNMVARKSGRIMNVASVAAFQPGPWMAGYYASKAYVLSFSEALATELKGTGVTITALCPGPTKTEFFDRAKMSSSKMKEVLFFAESMACAETGVNAMMQGKSLVVDGVLNRILVQSYRVLPRSFVRFFAGRLNS